jgi:hypothetical protein
VNSQTDVRIGQMYRSTYFDLEDQLKYEKAFRHNCQRLLIIRLFAQYSSTIRLNLNGLGEIDA